MTPEEAFDRWRRGEPIQLVDSRNPRAWEGSHVKLPGAVRILPDQAGSHELVRDRAIIVYCT